jgi:hypothetical protein
MECSLKFIDYKYKPSQIFVILYNNICHNLAYLNSKTFIDN